MLGWLLLAQTYIRVQIVTFLAKHWWLKKRLSDIGFLYTGTAAGARVSPPSLTTQNARLRSKLGTVSSSFRLDTPFHLALKYFGNCLGAANSTSSTDGQRSLFWLAGHLSGVGTKFPCFSCTGLVSWISVSSLLHIGVWTSVSELVTSFSCSGQWTITDESLSRVSFTSPASHLSRSFSCWAVLLSWSVCSRVSSSCQSSALKIAALYCFTLHCYIRLIFWKDFLKQFSHHLEFNY